ncbi:hypothetical protein KIN20_027540 [Parelaphostrongylus tenuis]|uniref:Uncharacterized protein n=1 Tax=Parelaphostrongylus tenuis TaxID=148309 RepID=A0AAD5QZX2_PARTN|nr:hypothetical protein KIN20_027540 [Parelaphostrongylus tenuis]
MLLQDNFRKPSNIICTISNIPFGMCAGARTTDEDGPFKHLSNDMNQVIVCSTSHFPKDLTGGRNSHLMPLASVNAR